MRKKIRGVSFDFGGTLYDYYPSNSEIWSRIAKRLGLAIAPDDPRIKDGMRKQNDAYYQMGKTFDRLSRAELHSLNCQVLNVIGVDGTNSIEIIDEEFGKREDGIGYQVFPDTKTTLDKIKRMGLKIGLVSNCPMRMAIKRRPMLKQTGILHYFDAIILSGEVGYQKPQPTIFEMALKKLEINDPSTVLHVGDCLFDDVYGAKNVGIVPILFDPLDVNYVENIIKLEKLSDILQYLE